MIGRTISHYRITGELGRGGMGVVYKARDTSLDRDVALKFLGADLAVDDNARRRFVNEAKAASSLDHPNICTIHEIGRTDEGDTYIVMPFYEGEPLDARARRGTAVDEAIELVSQAARGLASAHENGITHRDVKSQNIMVTRDGVVKVLDFGLARVADQTRLTETGTTVGTLKYMSPEQARGEETDARSDIFSLGVVLYELLTGTLPFPGDNAMALFYSITNTEPELPSAVRPGVPPGVDAVVVRALAKDPGQRYQSLHDMIADLDRARAAGAPAAARVPGAATRRRRTAPLVAAAVVVMAALSLWYFAGRGGGGATERAVSPAAQDASSGVQSIGVMYFENLSGDPALDWMQDGVVELLNTALSRSPELRVLDSQRMARLVRELGGDPRGGVDQSLAADVAERAGVSIMLVGNIVKSGDTIRLQAKLIDAGSGEILHSDFVEGRVDDDIFAMVAQLVERVQTYMQITRIAETVDEAWMRDISTGSVDAYRDFVQGHRWFIQNEHAKARPYFEQAIAADSNFVMAYVDLVGVCFNLGDYECIGRAYRRALQLRSRASHREKLYIDVAGAIINQEADKQIQLAGEILATDPGAHFWRYILGRGFYMSGQPERALREWEPLIDTGYDWVWTYLYASDAAVQLGRYDEGLRIIDRGLGITPPANTAAVSRLHRYRGRVLREAGDYDGAVAEFDRVLEIDPEYRPVIDYDLGRLHEARGDTARAIEYYRSHLEQDPDNAYGLDSRERLERLKP